MELNGFLLGGWKFCIFRVVLKKWAFYLNVNPVKKFFENPNFLATRFVRLVLAGLKSNSHFWGIDMCIPNGFLYLILTRQKFTVWLNLCTYLVLYTSYMRHKFPLFVCQKVYTYISYKRGYIEMTSKVLNYRSSCLNTRYMEQFPNILFSCKYFYLRVMANNTSIV